MPLDWNLFQSHAFPTSDPFWRCVCSVCGWMSLPKNDKPESQIDCPECAEHEKKMMLTTMENGWRGPGGGCGSGSSLALTKSIRKNLPKIIKKYDIKIINDAGGGNLNWIKHIKLENYDYVAYDLVIRHPKVVQLDITEQQMRHCDLIICRDVFIHFSNQMMNSAIKNFLPISKYLLISNYNNTNKKRPYHVGYFRRYNLMTAPFSFPKPLTVIKEPQSKRYLGLWSSKEVEQCIKN